MLERKISEIARGKEKKTDQEKRNGIYVKKSVNDILQLSLHSGALSVELSPPSPIIAFMLFLLYHPGHEMPKLIILRQCRCN